MPIDDVRAALIGRLLRQIWPQFFAGAPGDKEIGIALAITSVDTPFLFQPNPAATIRRWLNDPSHFDATIIDGPLPPEPGLPVVKLIATLGEPIFRGPSGQILRIVGADGFRWFEKWDRGAADVESLAAWYVRRGFTDVRVFLNYYYIATFGAPAYGVPPTPPLTTMDATPSRVRQFTQWCNAQGLRPTLNVGADWQRPELGLMTAAAIRAYLSAIVGAVSDLPCRIIVCNEPFKNLPEGVDLWRDIIVPLGLDQPSNRLVPMALGSYPETGTEVDFKHLDYIGTHTERRPWPKWGAKELKVLKDVFEQAHVACESEEMIGCAEADASNRDAHPEHWLIAGAADGMSGCGGTFHFEYGMQALVPPETSIQDQCATQYVRGLSAFPVDVARGQWSHDGRPDWPLEPAPQDDRTEVAGRLIGRQWYIVGAQLPEWVPSATPGHTILRYPLDSTQHALIVSA